VNQGCCTAVKERPILFSGPMVKALLAGTKTQTRRIVKPAILSWQPPVIGAEVSPHRFIGAATFLAGCPHGGPGDRLYVREAFHECPHCEGRIAYKAGGWAYADGSRDDTDERPLPPKCAAHGWCPSIHMPKQAARIWLEVTGVRVERLQAIAEEDAKAEGARDFFEMFPSIRRDQPLTSGDIAADSPVRAGFAVLWDEINGDRATWKSNPWIWAVTFRRVTP